MGDSADPSGRGRDFSEAAELFAQITDSFEQTLRGSMFRRTGETQPPGFADSELELSRSLLFDASVGRSSKGYAHYDFDLGVCLALTDACYSLSCAAPFCGWLAVAEEDVFALGGTRINNRFRDYRSILGPDGGIQRWFTEAYTNNPARLYLGNVLFTMAVSFISLHEQAHYLCGHLHFLHGRTEQLRFHEIPTEIGKGVDARDLRALELQADAFAAKHLLLKCTRSDGSDFPEASMSVRDEMFYAVLGMVVVFGILEIVDRAAPRDERTHPSAQARLLAVLDQFRRAMLAEIVDEQERNELCERLFTEVTVIGQQLGFRAFEPEAFNEFFDSDTNTYQTAAAQEVSSLYAHIGTLNSTMEVAQLEAIRSVGIVDSDLEGLGE